MVAAHPKAEADVAGDVVVREERVILEDEPDATAVGRHAREISAVEKDASLVGTRRRVVFPDPLGPRTVTVSPAETSRDASSSAARPS
jgi:hypothetical protein